MKIVPQLIKASLFIFIMACSSSSKETDGFTSSGTGDPGLHAEDIVSPGLSKLDPVGLYEAPTEITTVTLPRETNFRFSKQSKINKEKADIKVSSTSVGWYFFSFAEDLQNGVQDLGALDGPIDKIEPPESGYLLESKVPALEGHTYAVKGRDDEAGHFIIVRITGFGEQPASTPGETIPTITLDYFYR